MSLHALNRRQANTNGDPVRPMVIQFADAASRSSTAMGHLPDT